MHCHHGHPPQTEEFLMFTCRTIEVARMALRAILIACIPLIVSQRSPAQPHLERAAPTHADVSYGPHERNVLDFWQAAVDRPTPLVVYIHGGGFRGGSKDSLGGPKIQEFLDSGISVAALHYRLLAQGVLPAAHHDCRRAIQFLRSKARQWNLDPARFGAFGGSAGAQICMYLAFHDDMANPNSQNELERQSTRLRCVATRGGQTTLDIGWWIHHIPGYERPHRDVSEFFGRVSDDDRDLIIRDISALSLLTQDDPPIYMQYGMAPDDPEPQDPGRIQNWRVHHVNFGVALLRKAKELGVPAYLNYPGARVSIASDVDFFREQLLVPTSEELPAR
jgi:hypothetical protein